ncbi:hypothetical protein JCM8208_007851 [Rhodotorula glutinis]
MLHFEPPSTRPSFSEPARPTPAQSQYLLAAELDSHPARSSSMGRDSANPPPPPVPTSRIPTAAAGPSRMRAREPTLGASADGHSSESSLDPSGLHPPPRRRAASTGAGTRPVGTSSDLDSAPTFGGMPSSRSVPLGQGLADLQGKGERPATTIATAGGGPAPSSATPPVEPLSYASTAPAGAVASPPLRAWVDQQAPEPDGAPFGRVTTAPAFAVAEREPRKVPPPGPIVAPPHLPPLVKGLTGLTAYANWDVSNDVEWSLGKVVGPAALHEVIKDPEAFQSFRNFIAATSGDDESAPFLLDLYRDLSAFSHVCMTLRLSSSCISSTYLLKTSPSRLALPISLRGPVLECLYDAAAVGHPLLEPLQALHADIYTKFFQPFVQQKLVEQVVGRLASWKAGLGWTGKGPSGGGGGSMGLSMASTDGLAECYCLTDPSQRDNPITLASEGFVELTGYPLKLVIGRNCRFLQGPGTSPESVKRLHDALAEGRNVTSLIFNYRADGSAFANLLCMAPLKDDKGVVRHFIGGQIDVTGALNALVQSPSLAAHPSLWLHAAPPSSPSSASVALAPSFTPLVQAQMSRLTTVSRQTGVTSGDAIRELGAATLGTSAGGGGSPSQLSPRSVQAPSQLAAEDKKRKGPFGFLGKARKSTSTLSIRRSSLESTAAGGDEAPREAAAAQGSGDRYDGGGSGTRQEKRGSVGGGSAEQEHEEADSLAESLMHNGLRAFEQTYSRVALVERSTGDILYTTPELVEHCGLPGSSHHELHGTSFVKILVAPSSSRTSAALYGGGDAASQTTSAAADEEKDMTRRLRRNVRLAVEHGQGWTGLVGLQPVVKKLFGRSKHGELAVRDAVLHLTPLCNKEGKVEALVAVFG